MQGRIPFPFYVNQGKINCFLSSHIIRELYFGFYVLPDAPVHIFNGVGGIDDFPDLHGELKIAGQVFPVGFPR